MNSSPKAIANRASPKSFSKNSTSYSSTTSSSPDNYSNISSSLQPQQNHQTIPFLSSSAMSNLILHQTKQTIPLFINVQQSNNSNNNNNLNSADNNNLDSSPFINNNNNNNNVDDFDKKLNQLTSFQIWFDYDKRKNEMYYTISKNLELVSKIQNKFVIIVFFYYYYLRNYCYFLQ